MNGPARLIATALALAALATAMPPAMAGQAPGPPAQGAGRAARIPVELSDVLVHSPLAACIGAGSVAAAPKHSRIATWNIHAARSAPVSAVAAELQAMQADVIALQEVDVRTRRSGFIDEPADLARMLGFNYVFAASIKWDEGDYGLAVLSRSPLMDVRRHRLAAAAGGEPRIVLEATVCAGGRPLKLFNHHADVRAASRNAGFEEVRAILHPVVGQGLLVLGDFNEQADQPGVRGLIADGFVDLGADRNVSTTDGGRFDYLLADRLLAPLTSTARVWPTNKSDHHAVLADLEW